MTRELSGRAISLASARLHCGASICTIAQLAGVTVFEINDIEHGRVALDSEIGRRYLRALGRRFITSGIY